MIIIVVTERNGRESHGDNSKLESLRLGNVLLAQG
jgi:hypothetical protein